MESFGICILYFQTQYYKNNLDREPFYLHIVYEFSYTTASTPPSITPLLKTWVEFTPPTTCLDKHVGYSVVLATDGELFFYNRAFLTSAFRDFLYHLGSLCQSEALLLLICG